MEAKLIIKILQRIGCTSIRVRQSGWVTASCPFAPGTSAHKEGVDLHPSFAVSIAPKAMSFYNCYTCHATGSLKSLLWRLEEKVGGAYHDLYPLVKNDGQLTPDKLLAKIQAAEFYQTPQKVAGVMVSAEVARRRKMMEPPPISEDCLKPFKELSADALIYLTGPKRNLNRRAIDAWELGWDARDRRVVIPIRDCERNLVGYSRRLIQDPPKDVAGQKKNKPPPKFLHSKGFRRDFYLYGEHMRGKSRIGFLMEGFFDAIALWMRGYHGACAIMGSYLSEMQEHKILRFFDKVFIVRDGDAAGVTMMEAVEQKLRGKLPVTCVDTPDGYDPDNLSSEQLFEFLGPPTAEAT